MPDTTPITGQPASNDVQTEQQRIAQMLIQKDLQLTEANDRLERQIIQLNVLQDISLTVLGAKQEGAMNTVMQRLVQDLHFSAGFVFLMPHPMRLAAQCSYKQVDIAKVATQIAAIASWSESMVVTDLSKATPVQRALGEELKLTSYFACPLILQEQIKGIFICGLNDPYQRLSSADVEFLRTMAHSLSVFLESMEAADRQKRLDAMKSEFVSIVSHQLRTPLSCVKWILNMAQSGDLGDLTPEQKDFLLKAYNSNEHMIELVNDLLNVSRIEEGHMAFHHAPLDLKKLVEDILLAYQVPLNNRKLKLETNFAEIEPVFMQGDQDMLSIALTNIIDNAIKFSPIQGTLAIRLGTDRRGIVLTVQDAGIGMSPEDQAKLFSKFFRAENAKRMQTEGTGLGLFITKNIVEHHSGTITVESSLGHGTLFTCIFPA
jgi:signal transduction histidine kinase